MGFTSGGTTAGGVDSELVIVGPFTKTGTLSTGSGLIHWPNNLGVTLTIVECTSYCDTAPTGADLIVDVNKDGTTIFTGTKLVTTAGQKAGSSTGPFAIGTIADGETITVDIDQVGASVAGKDLTVSLVCSF